MSTENKVIDIVIDENVPFGMVLQFFDVDDTTGAQTPVNLTGYTLRGSISKSLDANSPVLVSFTTAIIDGPNGVASIALSKAAVDSLATQADNNRDKYNPRIRFAGFYDLILTRGALGSATSSTRIMEGRVNISDGVTK